MKNLKSILDALSMVFTIFYGVVTLGLVISVIKVFVSLDFTRAISTWTIFSILMLVFMAIKIYIDDKY